jgi:prepilin-type N-terminal cleavage/methylation domain-containing protein/prepilin-type processing-associated H-X9-DG protein
MSLRGFTLIELLVVVAVVAVLAALVVPVVGAGIARADSAKCLGNLRAMGAGLNAWLADNNMIMPPLAAARKSRSEDVPVIDTVLAAYLSDARVFACPADKLQAAQTGTSYYWNSVLSGQSATKLNFLSLVTDLSKIPVIVDKEGWHTHSEDKVNHLFADGHAANHLRLFTDP